MKFLRGIDMKTKLMFLFFFIALVICAQDSTSTDGESRKNHKWNWKFDWDFDSYENTDRRPMIEINYGVGFPKHEKMVHSLSKIGNAEIKIGFSRISNYDEDSDQSIINELNDNYFFASKLSSTLLTQKVKDSDFASDLIRFGFGRRTGYGYNAGSVYIIPYHTDAFLWSKLKSIDKSILTSPADFIVARRYLNNYRFSSLAEAGIKFEIAQTISFDASHETAVVFPRYQIWKHLGSVAIEMAGYGMIDNFVDKIFDRSPAAVPVVDFLLKNGLAYSLYLLKKENMNWPFNTETPLTYETFKLGVTFLF